MASKYDADNSAFPKRPSASSLPPKTPSSRKIPAQGISAQNLIHSVPQSGASTHPTFSASGSASVTASSSASGSPALPRASRSNARWLKRWPLVMLVLFGIAGTAGTAAMISLFRVPNLPNCRAIFWPTASASLRLQCAEAYADQGDVKNLLAAIALVDKLPEDHPLRADINSRIESWATQVLDLAERAFEAGDIEEAIAAAKKIPAKTAAAKLVDERIVRWKGIWKEGEDGFNEAIVKLKAKNFQAAFSLSVKLLDVPNKFWSTVKYNELTKLIAQGREDSRKLSEALDFAKEGTVKGFVEALKRLKEIDQKSLFYAEAQGKRKDIAKQMLKIGESLLAARQLSNAQIMLAAIPRDAGVNKEIEDFQIFVSAYQQAWSGTMGGLENAIARMKTLGKNRPRYAKGQQLIAQWQGELQNISLLNQAKERAARGSTTDLTAAIAIAKQVSRNSPQSDEANKQVGQWQTQVETVEDRPILERADRLAAVGTADNLRAAIQEARKVGSRRALGKEADSRIATWTGRIQRIEDQPVIDMARQRARNGDLAGAIATAKRIGEGRALYDAAQDDIAGWQAEENGRLRLDEAVNVAARGDGDALSKAITIAQRVPAQSNSRSRADSQIDNWSWDLLRQAETAANQNVESAIALADKIPTQAEAYDSAQVRIGNWQETLRRLEGNRRPAPAPSPGNRSTAPDASENDLPQNLELAPPRE
ncbi:MAG: hypothetical protein WBA76_01990 [Phormidesmis sp.]